MNRQFGLGRWQARKELTTHTLVLLLYLQLLATDTAFELLFLKPSHQNNLTRPCVSFVACVQNNPILIQQHSSVFASVIKIPFKCDAPNCSLYAFTVNYRRKEALSLLL